jgi:hypothetical protein
LATLAAVTVFINPAHSAIIVGYTREQVVQELGVPDSSAKVGTMESLIYKNGTCITLQNGKVEDIKVRGQIRLGKIVRDTSGSATASPAARPLPDAPSPNSVVAHSSTPDTPSPVAFSTNIVARETTTDNEEAGEASEQEIEIPKSTHQPMAGLQPTQLDTIMSRVRRMIDAMAFFLVLFVVATHAFLSFCFKVICEKVGKAPGNLVWIPLVQFIPLLRAASMPVWFFALLFVPLVNVVILFVLWGRICIALKRSPWLIATLLVPVVNVLFFPYLAFSKEAEEETTPAQSWPTPKPPPTGAPLKSHPLSDSDANFPVDASVPADNQPVA